MVGYLVYSQMRGNLEWLRNVGLVDLVQSRTLIFDSIYRLGLQVGLFLLVLAAADYWWQRREFETSIRMSKEEIKEEYKQMEGDPLIRSRIRQRQRQIAQQRMMQAVPTADVIVTNPTHFAVAIKYTPGEMAAPQVVAKGRALLPKGSRKKGKSIVLLQYRTRSWLGLCTTQPRWGRRIPAHLYPAVAEVLAFVYRLRRKTV